MTTLVQLHGAELLPSYRSIVGNDSMRLLESLARRLQGHRVVMVNSTATGGGVAEILQRLVTLFNELGVPTTWEVMPGDARFYAITKTIHNTLHGHPGVLTEDDWEYYHEMNRRAAERLILDGDLIMIHDPQPAGVVHFRRKPGQVWLWRCHIDLSHADPAVWRHLGPIVDRYDSAVFSHTSFVQSLGIPSYLVPPSIDPISDKNRELEPLEIERLLEPFDLPSETPLITQVSRFDRLKDPVGVVEAFLLARAQEAGHLVLAGGTADDDPEGAEVLEEVRARAGDHRDITILALPPDSHLQINAMQRRSAVVVQKSLREGFALTISEALWKRRAVIGGAVGGIPLQILHERTGMLVRSVEGCALQIIRLLRSAPLRRRLGHEGYEHVRENFLHPREARDYLSLFARVLFGDE